MPSNINERDEILDIVNAADKVLKQMPRSEIYKQGMSNFRVVNVFIENSEGQLWIPRRTENKKLFPLCLDMSMGGHVTAGETYEEALCRELKEELRMVISNYRHEFLGQLTPERHRVSAFMKVYGIYTDDTPNYNENDFVESFWLFPNEILARLQNGDRAKDDLPILIKHFYLDSMGRCLTP